jgi:hypothetical protein
MLCRKVLRRLSEYMDEVLDPDAAVQVSQHLNQCESCREEYKSLSEIQKKIKSIPKSQPPKYLRGLIQIRLTTGRQEPWHAQLRNMLERRWSIIRTTDGMYYWTRALGTVATVLFILLITKVDMNVDTPIGYRAPRPLTPAYRQQVGIDFLKKMGMQRIETPTKKNGRNLAAINDQYLLSFGKSVSRSGDDDSFSLDLSVDPSGAPTIQDVIEYPSDQKLLHSFNEMIATARCRPAENKNGRNVTSHMVLVFSRVTVSN